MAQVALQVPFYATECCFFLFQRINNFQFNQLYQIIQTSIIDVNSDEDTSNLENLRALFATLEKKEIDSQNEKQMLKVENQSKKLEWKESQKENQHLLQDLEKVKSKNQNLQKNLEDVQNEKEKIDTKIEFLKMELTELKQAIQKNESDKKDTQIESLNLELTELKQAIQSFLSGNLTLKSMSNLVKNSATPEIVPKQSEKVQRAEMSHSNDEEEQISDLMPDQEAVQTPNGQLLTFSPSEVQEKKQQPMEVTKLERVQDVQISYSNEGIGQIHD